MTHKLYLENPEIAVRFEAVKATLPGADEPALADLRATAMARFSEMGIPGPKVEEWKYTSLGFLTRETFDQATPEIAAHDAEILSLYEAAFVGDGDDPRLVFVNGGLYPGLSAFPDQAGVDLVSLAAEPEYFREVLTATADSSSLDNLNRALATDGYRLDIAPGVICARPLQIIHIATSGMDGRALRNRVRIALGAGAEARIIESFVGAADTRYWTHMVSDVDVAPGADLAIFQLQMQGKAAIHMTELHSRIGEKARFSHVSLQLGAEVSRTELINSFTGEGATVALAGAYLGRVNQSHDIFTRINHDLPRCQSDQIYRGVLDAGGRAAFQGKVVVARDAQKTVADQSNKTLLLSRKAEANAKPELLIYADDVKCSHGATVGELDPDQLFYLRSRGMDQATAKGLLVEAFVAEVFDDMADEGLMTRFKEKTAGWLSQEPGEAPS